MCAELLSNERKTYSISNSAKIFEFEMHDNDEKKKLPISNKLFINDWLVDTNCSQQSRYFLCGNIIFHNITVHSVHYLMGQFALYAYVLSVFKVFRFQFSAVKDILKKMNHFTETKDNK